MCGIAGFAGRGDRVDLAAMISALIHRGPDGEGVFVDPDMAVFLGHRRLAVLDIAGGHQPMWNEDGTVGIVFNGEIYNHAALRGELERCGHVFRTHHSDTEVLVHGYEEWGEDLPGRLNGMFAFAVLDRARRRIFLARDRFGEKPLFYTHRRGLFAFASELSALIQHRQIGSTVDVLGLQKFCAYGYFPAPYTPYADCLKLPGGHYASFDIDTGTLRTECYWRFRLEPDESLAERDEPRLAEELAHLLFQAVERRLVADVPLGIFLSGGIDSNSVLAAATRSRPAAGLRTFTIGFTEPSFDESPLARSSAAFFGTRHREKILDFDTAQEMIPGLLGRLDEPSGDASLLPTYLLSAFTREHVTVALSGDGGDELFAGYDPFKALRLARYYARLMPRGAHSGIRRLVDLLPISSRNMSLEFRLRRALMGLSYPESLWNPVWMSPVEPSEMGELFHQPLRPEELYSEAIALWDRDPGADPIDRTLEFFTNFYLPDDILTKVDRAAMAVSLESRAIFLDNDVVEFCRRLPNRFKFRNGERKVLLKKAMAALLPPIILQRPKKGFGIPLGKWLRRSSATMPMTEISGMRLAGVARRWREHQSRRADNRLFLWCWLSLQYGLPPTAQPEQLGAA